MKYSAEDSAYSSSFLHPISGYILVSPKLGENRLRLVAQILYLYCLILASWFCEPCSFNYSSAAVNFQALKGVVWGCSNVIGEAQTTLHVNVSGFP